MTNIQLDDNVALALESLARSNGMDLADYLASMAKSPVALPSPRLSADDLVSMIKAESGADGSEYRGTYSREDIYLDHD